MVYLPSSKGGAETRSGRAVADYIGFPPVYGCIGDKSLVYDPEYMVLSTSGKGYE